MSKTRRKNRSEAEHFRGEIKKLESENRQLKKRLKALDKREHFYDDLIEAVAGDIKTTEKCKKCKVGDLAFQDFKHIQFIVCNNCKDRNKV